MSDFTYNEDRTQARHSNVPDILIAHHPYSKDAEHPLDHIQMDATAEDPKLGKRPDLEAFLEHLKDVPEQYKPFAKGTIHIYGNDGPTEGYNRLDISHYPYSRSGKSFTRKPVPNSTLYLYTEPSELHNRAIPIITANMIDHFVDNNPHGRQRIQGLFETHRQLFAPNFPTKRNTTDKLSHISGPDMLRSLLNMALAGDSWGKVNNVSQAMSKLSEIEKNIDDLPRGDPKTLYHARKLKLAKDVLEHHFPNWRKEQ